MVKDRRFFEAIGYPKEFEQIKAEVEDPSAQSEPNSYTEGSFRVIGDKCVLLFAPRGGSVFDVLNGVILCVGGRL